MKESPDKAVAALEKLARETVESAQRTLSDTKLTDAERKTIEEARDRALDTIEKCENAKAFLKACKTAQPATA